MIGVGDVAIGAQVFLDDCATLIIMIAKVIIELYLVITRQRHRGFNVLSFMFKQ